MKRGINNIILIGFFTVTILTVHATSRGNEIKIWAIPDNVQETGLTIEN